MDDSFQLKPMEFGEILGTGWKLTRKTTATAGVLIALAIVPLAITGGLALNSMLGAIAEMALDPAMQGRNPEPQVFFRHIMPIIGSILIFIPVIFLAALFALLAQTATTIAGWEEMNGRTLSIGELLRRSFQRIYWHALAQVGIMYGIALAANVVVGIVGAILAVATMGIGTIFLHLAYQITVMYVTIGILFRLHVMVAEGRGPWQSLVLSFRLVKDNWWRTFGVFFVLLIGCEILALLILLPATIPFITFIIDFAQRHQGRELAPAEVRLLFSQIGSIFSPLVMSLLGLLGAAFTLMMVNTFTAMYVDLRARRGDFANLDGDEL